MKRIILLLAAIISFSFIIQPKTFTGRIHYTYAFTDLKGTDLLPGASRMIGREQFYFINDSNYKSTDENHRITQLYNSKTNSHYGFNKDHTATRTDALMRTSQTFNITKQAQTEKILGYECDVYLVETDDSNTLYYITKKLRIDPAAFQKHNYADWNNYLKATNGAISLKQVITNHKSGYIWTMTADEITPMALSGKDFEFPKDYTLNE